MPPIKPRFGMLHTVYYATGDIGGMIEREVLPKLRELGIGYKNQFNTGEAKDAFIGFDQRQKRIEISTGDDQDPNSALNFAVKDAIVTLYYQTAHAYRGWAQQGGTLNNFYHGRTNMGQITEAMGGAAVKIKTGPQFVDKFWTESGQWYDGQALD